jgi:hypothetical protein
MAALVKNTGQKKSYFKFTLFPPKNSGQKNLLQIHAVPAQKFRPKKNPTTVVAERVSCVQTRKL